MTDLIDDNQLTFHKRPVLLTILCVMTWIGSAIQFAWGSWMTITIVTASRQLSNEGKLLTPVVLVLVASILTKLGAIRLFRLKKGLLTYLLGELIPPGLLLATLFFLHHEKPYSPFFQNFIVFMMGLSAVFILLYCLVVIRNKNRFYGRTTR